VDKVALNAAAEQLWGCSHAFEHEIRLVTGRTHQIRAQMAAVASPLLGDVLYNTLQSAGIIETPQPHAAGTAAQPSKLTADMPQMKGGPESEESSGRQAGYLQTNTAPCSTCTGHASDSAAQSHGDMQIDEAAGEELPGWIYQLRKAEEQELPLGLQAARLMLSGRVFGAEPLVIDAGEPWWRK
jgi:hypothetical protein